MDLFPELEVKSLLGQSATFPADLPARRTIVVAAFLQDQQSLVDRWIDALAAEGVPDTPLDQDDLDAVVIEVPVLPSRYSMMRRYIDGGMARTIAKPDVLARTWTAYANVDAFRKATGIPTKRVEAMVVNRVGAILARAHGEPSLLDVDILARKAMEAQ
jgi:hypothetical protein